MSEVAKSRIAPASRHTSKAFSWRAFREDTLSRSVSSIRKAPSITMLLITFSFLSACLFTTRAYLLDSYPFVTAAADVYFHDFHVYTVRPWLRWGDKNCPGLIQLLIAERAVDREAADFIFWSHGSLLSPTHSKGRTLLESHLVGTGRGLSTAW